MTYHLKYNDFLTCFYLWVSGCIYLDEHSVLSCILWSSAAYAWSVKDLLIILTDQIMSQSSASVLSDRFVICH